MSKPASYPFLAIAKQYGVDYGDVLLVAQFWSDRHADGGNANPHEHDAIYRLRDKPGWREVTADIARANREQQAIRDGLIDWQTGEPAKEATPWKYDVPPHGHPEPGTLAYAMQVDADMTDPRPKPGETPSQAKMRRDYYRGYDDDGLPSD